MYALIKKFLLSNYTGDLITIDFMFETTCIFVSYKPQGFIRFGFTFGGNHFPCCAGY